MKIKGILSFPTLFKAKVAQGANEAKYSCSILIHKEDPQIETLKKTVEEIKANTFPSGFPKKGNVCFDAYKDKYGDKDYYDPKFEDYYIFSCTAKENDKPIVVDSSLQPILDPAEVYPGQVAYVNAGISGYTKGTGGVGGWLNGVMVTDEEPPFGRLDGKPTVDQMFAGVAEKKPAF